VAVTEIVPHVYAISLGPVNVFLLDSDGLTLIDTGVPDSAGKILAAVESLGKRAEDIAHILVTHCHADHSGSLAELKRKTGATAVMHPLDAALVRKGESMRPVSAAPGVANWLVYNLFIKRMGLGTVEPAEIEQTVADGDELPVAGGLQVIHLPGHSAGQVGFLWPQHGGILFAGDVASNLVRLGYPPIFENLAEGQRSLARLGGLDFEVACFGHGKAIVGGAAARFQQKWAAPG
jgi:glyoxylase-like metal-dependent hydrolase (beta-lactamase superfamily II)